MAGRLLGLTAVVASLVGFIAQVTGTTDWWAYTLNRASYVLVVLGVVAALLVARRESLIVVAAQVLLVATALAFTTVALLKFYDATSAYPGGYPSGFETASTWLAEAELLSVAVLAFGLTLARRRSTGAVVWLAGAVAMAVGSAVYAIIEKQGLTAYIWWTVAGIGGFLAASAAAGLDRGGRVARSTPVPASAGGEPRSEPTGGVSSEA